VRSASTRSGVTLDGANSSDATLQHNLKAEYALEQRLLVAAAFSCACGALDSEADREQMVFAIDKGAKLILPTAPDAVFQATATARAAALAYLESQNLKPASSRNVVLAQPAVVLAHRLEVDVDTFIARNRVKHPLFVNGAVHG